MREVMIKSGCARRDRAHAPTAPRATQSAQRSAQGPCHLTLRQVTSAPNTGEGVGGTRSPLRNSKIYEGPPRTSYLTRFLE